MGSFRAETSRCLALHACAAFAPDAAAELAAGEATVFEPATGFWLVLGVFALFVGSFVFWVVALAEVAGIPDQQFRAASTTKTLWILLVVLTGVAGPFIWRFGKRRDVRAVTAVPALPSGWYLDPEPGTRALRWWDGARWTSARHDLPSPPTQSGGRTDDHS